MMRSRCTTLKAKQLFAIAADAPTSEDALYACAGMYPSIVKKFGDGILRAVRTAG